MPQEETQEPTQGEQPQGGEFSFDAWLGEQPEHVRKGYEAHTAGLKTTLEKERNERKEFGRLLKELTPKAEKGSELERALGETSTRLEQAERRAAFAEDAGKPEIGCTNPRAAFLVAEAEGLFTKRGEPDWAAIKATAPELFTRKVANGNAGTGTQSEPAKPGGMNEFIRAAARRG
jgi:hypothetical protein